MDYKIEKWDAEAQATYKATYKFSNPAEYVVLESGMVYSFHNTEAEAIEHVEELKREDAITDAIEENIDEFIKNIRDALSEKDIDLTYSEVKEELERYLE